MNGKLSYGSGVWWRVLGVGCVVLGTVMMVGLANTNAEGGPRGPARTAARVPQVLAVRFHADWCGACKKLNGVIAELRRRTSDAPVLYLTLDLTDEMTRRQAEYLAGVVGLDQVWAAQGNKVGSIVFVDGASKRALSNITATDSIAELEGAVRESIKTAQRSG